MQHRWRALVLRQHWKRRWWDWALRRHRTRSCAVVAGHWLCFSVCVRRHRINWVAISGRGVCYGVGDPWLRLMLRCAAALDNQEGGGACNDSHDSHSGNHAAYNGANIGFIIVCGLPAALD